MDRICEPSPEPLDPGELDATVPLCCGSSSTDRVPVEFRWVVTTCTCSCFHEFHDVRSGDHFSVSLPEQGQMCLARPPLRKSLLHLFKNVHNAEVRSRAEVITYSPFVELISFTAADGDHDLVVGNTGGDGIELWLNEISDAPLDVTGTRQSHLKVSLRLDR